MSRYRDERNEAFVQVQAKQAEIAKLNAIIAQMASSQAAQPSLAVFNRQTDEYQPSSSTPGGALKQPSKRTGNSVIKQVETANGKQDVSCESVGSAVEVKKGQRVVVCRANSTEYGTVRAVNVAIDVKKGFTGVEMDLPSMYIILRSVYCICFSKGGNTDGEAKGVRHFKWLVYTACNKLNVY